jgi:NADH-quinone oxidoreductase subunit I
MLGEGILKGLARRRRISPAASSKERLTTVQYPEERIAPIENTRDFPFLVYDGTTPWPVCVAWPARSAKKSVRRSASTSSSPPTRSRISWAKMQIYPARFDIDISVCMSCQICVEVCPFEAIKMDTEFELSTTDRFGGLLFDREHLSKSNEHYTRFIPPKPPK